MAKGVAITYGDIAPEAKESFNPSASESVLDTLLNLQRYNMQLYNYASPCELYQTVLDGTAAALPSDIKKTNIGLWSEQLSNDDGTFSEPITLTLESEGQYSSQGFTLTFDKFNDIHPTSINIKWYRAVGESVELLSDKDFEPSSSVYFCKNKVESFNRAVITFYALNMPQNRLRVEIVDYGYGTVFYGDELRNVKLSQSIDPISSEIKINTCDFTLDSHTDIVYSFQSKQPLSVSFNDKLLATVFVKSSKRNAKFLWDISAEDYIGLMDSTAYAGGIYENANAGELLEDIFTACKIPYSITNELYSTELSGYIPYTTCREALMQVCFASGAVVNTANTDVVEVKILEADVKQTIPLSRIMQGQSFEDGDTVTSVELTAHTYSAIYSLSLDPTEVYNAAESGAGKNILVKFSEPLHDLEITNGEILSSGANYAYINADKNCVLSGQTYKHTQTVKAFKNPVVLASEKENVLSITSATLVSQANAERILENCYNWLAKTSKTMLQIIVGKDISKRLEEATWGRAVWGDFVWGNKEVIRTEADQADVELGDVIGAETEYLGNMYGRVVSQSFSLDGNTIVKECELV